MKNRVVIAGGRDYTNYDELKEVCDVYIKERYEDIEVVSGCARGADKLGQIWAKEYKIPIAKFPADWNNLGKAAGPIRNKAMAEYGNILIAFWDGESTGTKDMIDNAHKNRFKEVLIYRTDLGSFEVKPNRLW